MAESRRVQLTTLSGDHGPPPPGEPVPVPASVPPSVPAPHREPPSGDPADGSGRTVRLELTLFEADEMRFPEFSYTQLADNKIEHTKEKVQLSRFEEQEQREHEEIVATSRKLERKYGNEPKKKKQDRIQDLIDIGFGYDDEDSFIDNSEAYDEFVPASITTKFGGFYVNSGVLHFRQASETEDPATEEETLESSDVRSSSEKNTHKRGSDLKVRLARVIPTLLALSPTGPVDEIKRKKKKKKRSAGPLSVTSMLKKFQREKAKERQKTEKANQKSPLPSPLCPADAGGGSGSTDPLLSLIGSTDDHAFIQAANAVDLDIDLDSLLDVTERTRTFAVPQVRPPDAEVNSGSASPHRPVQLPEGLPPRLEDSIRKLTAVAKTSEGESKLKFFTPEINLVLLDIEVQCREQGVHLRSKVYTHLSSFLPCSRDTLLKRVKKLHLKTMLDNEVKPLWPKGWMQSRYVKLVQVY
uniref:Ubinuclein 1 n=1 Tax=Gasterosteus aculeatus aculeatus TaxID=481459 RepID=G3Q7J3_GASAC